MRGVEGAPEPLAADALELRLRKWAFEQARAGLPMATPMREIIAQADQLVVWLETGKALKLSPFSAAFSGPEFDEYCREQDQRISRIAIMPQAAAPHPLTPASSAESPAGQPGVQNEAPPDPEVQQLPGDQAQGAAP